MAAKPSMVHIFIISGHTVFLIFLFLSSLYTTAVIKPPTVPFHPTGLYYMKHTPPGPQCLLFMLLYLALTEIWLSAQLPL